jgi:DNA-binding response OmpR family regulator
MNVAMRRILGQVGIEAVTSDTAHDGLLTAGLERFDLILIARRLADGEGLELCRTIRAFDTKTTVYLLTGWTHPGRRRQALNVGAPI